MLETIKDIVSIFGVLFGLITIIIGVLSYRKKVRLDQVKFIQETYKEFNSEPIDRLYIKIVNFKLVNIIDDSVDEQILCRVLTIFDNIYNYYSRGILDNKSLELIGCEILDFYKNIAVINYIKDVHDDCKNDKIKEEIWPFTGLLKLGPIIRNKYVNNN
jgi:hypothetical protein